MQITEDCIDPLFSRPVIDTESDWTSPSPYHRVHGHFEGTEVRFGIYLPPKEDWSGRFFHHVYPLVDEYGEGFDLNFTLNAGAYFVQTASMSGYRGDAAAAKFSRQFAQQYYGEQSERIYGYIYGGSGGSFQTIGAVENTVGLWDGGVPVVQAVPVSNPNSMSIRSLAGLVLRPKARDLENAVRPGGGDHWTFLDKVQRDIFREASTMGIPIRAWENFTAVANPDLLLQMMPSVKAMDPSYADDWWTKAGYLGTEMSPVGDILRSAKIDYNASIKTVERDSQGSPVRIELNGPKRDLETTGVEISLYEKKGTSRLGTFSGTLDKSGKEVQMAAQGNTAAILDSIKEGLQVRIDNKWFLAMHSYHRHQVPKQDGFYGFDQFLNDDGTPVYPQRNIDVSSTISHSTSGGASFSGSINCKIIAVNNIIDADAFPWHADWYRAQVQRKPGSDFDNNYRLWYNDHADHHMGPIAKEKERYLVDFMGIYHQALLDLSEWVEEGVPPPDSSGYAVEDSQVSLSEDISVRRGIQPRVVLHRTGGNCRKIHRSTPVTFRASVEVPPGAGQVTRIEWDFEGTGVFVEHNLPKSASDSDFDVEATHRYSKGGVYIANVRVTCQRDPRNKNSLYTRVMNLGRLRVNVE